MSMDPVVVRPRLTGRRALVTGGGTGVGRGIALAFAREGAAVVVCGRRREPLDDVVGEIVASGGRASAMAADVAGDGAQSLVSGAIALLGGLDVLVNNAGVYVPRSVDESSLDDLDRTLAVNLRAPFLLARAAHPALTERSGVVLNISSTIGARPVPGAAAYCIAKAGLDMLTRVLALEWAASGVRAVSLQLGIVDTPIHEARAVADPVEWRRSVDAMHPLGRIGSPMDVAAAAVFFASAEASWITGAVVTIDGGISLS